MSFSIYKTIHYCIYILYIYIFIIFLLVMKKKIFTGDGGYERKE